MVRVETPICNFGEKSPDFELLGTNNKMHNLKDLMGKNGLLVMFICNHCPYVQSIIDKIIRDTTELKTLGINSVAIMSNDPTEFIEDSFENMQKIAKKLNFPFPYLIDKTQTIAKSYGAVCTPDFFGYNNKFELQYRGRLDSSSKEKTINTKRDLFIAMTKVAKTGYGPKHQISSMGCSIKWL